MRSFLDIMFFGILTLSFKGYVFYVLIMTHITIVTVTVYYHRAVAHRALTLHPSLAHFFRFWGWFTTSMNVREWSAIHRYHHAEDDGPQDPHSPWVYGIWYVLFFGVVLYYRAAGRPSVMKRALDIKDDWLDTKLYGRRKYLGRFYGVGLLLLINSLLFGAVGILIWILQVLWIPFWAAGVINGLGHWPIFKQAFGYRNFETKDHSANILPWGIWIGGEELHNNHHKDPISAKLSIKWYEFDIGWFYIRLFEILGLVTIRQREVRIN